MEVKINNSIDIEPVSKKKRPRISKPTEVTEDSSSYVSSTNYTKSDKAPNKSKDSKNFKQKKPYKRPVRTVDELKEGIIKSLESTGGKYVKFDDVNHTEGILVCGIIDAEDPNKIVQDDICFAVINHNRNLIYVPYENRFSVMKEPSLKCSVLDWLYRNETATIVDTAIKGMEEDNVDIFTNIYLNKPVVKATSKKDKKKNKKSQNK